MDISKKRYSNHKSMQEIIIKGARTHNLKNIDLTLPKKKLIVVTGVSGSGKSSLSIDTIYAEGQRRYIESLSSYARQFLSRMNKPDVDYIKGLCPAIALEQKVAGGNNRSTVGTLTEIYEYLRLLYARVGTTYSPKTGKKVQKDEVVDVVNYIMNLDKTATYFIGFEIKSTKNAESQLNVLLNKGFNRLWDGKKFIKIEDLLDSGEKWKTIYVVVKRFSVPETIENAFVNEISDSVQTAFEENQFECEVINTADNTNHLFNNKFEADGITFEQPSPQFYC
jgi:excinuclease ABC subunit A